MRKIIIFIISVTTLLFFSCREQQPSSQLTETDSLIETNADSALTLLQTKYKNYAHSNNPADSWYYRLLCAKAADKAYKNPKSDKEISAIIRHYEKTGDKQLLAQACYVAGNIYSELDNFAKAQDSYNKAIDNIDKDHTPRLWGRCHAGLGYLFSNQELYQYAKTYFNESYTCDSLMDNKIETIYDLRDLGTCYYKTGSLDSAYICYSKSMFLSRKYRDTEAEENSFRNMTRLFIKWNKLDSAKIYVNALKVRQDNTSTTSILYASYFSKTGNKEKALYYYKQTEETTDNISSKYEATKWLYDYYVNSNKDKANTYLEKKKILEDSIKHLDDRESVLARQLIYRFNKKEDKNIRKITFTITAILLFLLLGGTIFYKTSKKRRHSTTSKNIEREEENIELKKNLDKEDIGKTKNGGNIEKVYKNEPDSVTNNPVVKKVRIMARDKSTTDFKLTQEEFAELYRVITTAYPQLKQELMIEHGLSELNYKVCLFIAIEIPPSKIALFLNKTKQAITNIRKDMYKRTFKKDMVKARDWDNYIYSLRK